MIREALAAALFLNVALIGSFSRKLEGWLRFQLLAFAGEFG